MIMTNFEQLFQQLAAKINAEQQFVFSQDTVKDLIEQGQLDIGLMPYFSSYFKQAKHASIVLLATAELQQKEKRVAIEAKVTLEEEVPAFEEKLQLTSFILYYDESIDELNSHFITSIGGNAEFLMGAKHKKTTLESNYKLEVANLSDLHTTLGLGDINERFQQFLYDAMQKGERVKKERGKT